MAIYSAAICYCDLKLRYYLNLLDFELNIEQTNCLYSQALAMTCDSVKTTIFKNSLLIITLSFKLAFPVKL